MRIVNVKVPATTANLGPGFDALGLALDLWNEFEFVVESPEAGAPPWKSELILECGGEGAGELPRNESNLVYQAFIRGLGAQAPAGRIRLRIHNNVPLSSGLGSSATAIVGGLAAAQVLVRGELSIPELVELATRLEGHPDNVAAAILGGLVASVTAEDGRVETISVPPPEKMWVCLAVPDFYVSTHQSRGRLPERVSRAEAVFNLSRSALWVAAVATGRLEALRVATQDALHQPYRAELIPGLRDVFAAAESAGAYGVALSGSGPSVAAFCAREVGDRVGEAMTRAFRKVGVTARVFLVRPSTSGVRFEVSETAQGRVSRSANA